MLIYAVCVQNLCSCMLQVMATVKYCFVEDQPDQLWPGGRGVAHSPVPGETRVQSPGRGDVCGSNMMK